MKTEKSEPQAEAKPDNADRVKKLKSMTTAQPVPTKRDFGIIAKMFEGETQEVQNTLIGVSTQLQLVKLNLSEQPAVINYLVKKSFPNLVEADLLKLLNSEKAPNLDTAIDKINNTIENYSNTEWNVFWNNLFLANCAEFVDWVRLCSYAPYVYNVLVKPVIR